MCMRTFIYIHFYPSILSGSSPSCHPPNFIISLSHVLLPLSFMTHCIQLMQSGVRSSTEASSAHRACTHKGDRVSLPQQHWLFRFLAGSWGLCLPSMTECWLVSSCAVNHSCYDLIYAAGLPAMCRRQCWDSLPWLTACTVFPPSFCSYLSSVDRSCDIDAPCIGEPSSNTCSLKFGQLWVALFNCRPLYKDVSLMRTESCLTLWL